MNKEKFKEIMKERERLWEETQDEDYFGMERCAKNLAQLVKEDILGFIKYLRLECTAEEYLCIADSLDQIIQEVKSQELVDAFRETMNGKFLKENQKYDIRRDLDEAIEDYGNGKVH